MKKLFWAATVLAALAGGAVAIAQRRGRLEKIRGYGLHSTSVIGGADGPISVLVSGISVPHTFSTYLRNLSAFVCRIAAACLCGPGKKVP